MKVWSRIFAIVFVAGLATALADVTNTNTQNNTSMSNAVNTHEVAVINTTDGEMVIEFWPDIAPKTVANFEKLAREGFYDGTCFHRIIKGFMIQGGDPLSKDPTKEFQWGTGGPGYQFADEITPNNRNDVGTISMANAGPNTNGSQFFINVAPNNFLDTKHTVFGTVTGGMDIVNAISHTTVDNRDCPIDAVVIEKATVST